MKAEIDAAIKFILKLIKQNSNINENDLLNFQHCLRIFLTNKFSNHWHPERPWQGQGYRCLRVNGVNGNEPTIAKAASESGLKYSDLKLPPELTVWVDPDEVCCRFGEHKGSYFTVASFQKGKSKNSVDDIDLNELVDTDINENHVNLKECSTNKNSTTCSPSKKISSMKENVDPTNVQNFYNYSNNNSPPSFLHVENRLKQSYNSNIIPDNEQGLTCNFSGYHEYFRKLYPTENGTLPYNQEDIGHSPYNRPQWVPYSQSASPPQQQMMTNGYYDYTSPRFSPPQDKIYFRRPSPLRLNSVPFSVGNTFVRGGSYLRKPMARV